MWEGRSLVSLPCCPEPNAHRTGRVPGARRLRAPPPGSVPPAQCKVWAFRSRSRGIPQPAPRHFVLLLLCSTWPRTRLALPSTCRFLSSLSSPLKKRKKTKPFPHRLQTQVRCRCRLHKANEFKSQHPAHPHGGAARPFEGQE